MTRRFGTAAMEKFRELAKKFMDVVHLETGFNVVIYNDQGRIVQATDESRVNNFHPGAVKMMGGDETDFSVSATEALDNSMVREGYNRAIIAGGEKIGGFGISGPLEITKPLGRMAAKIIESWLDEFTLFNELEQRVKERTQILNQEIEARKEAENILRENQARFEAFTRAIPDILFVFDEDGRYIEIFTSSKDLLVDDLSALKGTLIHEILPPEVAKIHHDSIRQVAETGDGCFYEYKLEVPKGVCWFESRAALIRGLDHEKKLIASSVRDITRRKLAEKEVSEKEKLSVVIETAGAVCHEFNQPLQIISGSCELLNTFSGLNPEVSRIICNISDQVRRMGKLNKNLMNITSYKTKTYLESKIIDIDKSAAKSNGKSGGKSGVPPSDT